MIKLTEIEKDELPGLVKASYEGDTDLLDKYHVKKFSLEAAVESEIVAIEKTSATLQFKFFKVLWGKKDIGYLVLSGDFLYSFCVNIKYRTKDILTEWWSALIKEIGKLPKVALNTNNTRAINYMQKRGLSICLRKGNEVLLT